MKSPHLTVKAFCSTYYFSEFGELQAIRQSVFTIDLMSRYSCCMCFEYVNINNEPLSALPDSEGPLRMSVSSRSDC